ncbi:hypothetical protein JKP88DRAFT_261961 [Tribonema minus]|uniref:Uncharacterized protein n=1 Tax=Tribonema minus TaxID=303371 RepID=A0A836CM18_9STRA|nr:hypothetical protein JKP88DRAFT_261961 [Tribonema minus]
MNNAVAKLEHKLASLVGMLNRGSDWQAVPEVVMLTFIEVTDLLREQNKAIREMSVEIRQLKRLSKDRDGGPGLPPDDSDAASVSSAGAAAAADAGIMDQLTELQRQSNSRHRHSRSRAAIADSKGSSSDSNSPTGRAGGAAAATAAAAAAAAAAAGGDGGILSNSGTSKKKPKSKGVRFAEEDDVHVYTMSLADFQMETKEEGGDDAEAGSGGSGRKRRSKSKKSNKELVFVFENGDGTISIGDNKGNVLAGSETASETGSTSSTASGSRKSKAKKSVKFRDDDDVQVIYDAATMDAQHLAAGADGGAQTRARFPSHRAQRNRVYTPHVIAPTRRVAQCPPPLSPPPPPTTTRTHRPPPSQGAAGKGEPPRASADMAEHLNRILENVLEASPINAPGSPGSKAGLPKTAGGGGGGASDAASSEPPPPPTAAEAAAAAAADGDAASAAGSRSGGGGAKPVKLPGGKRLLRVFMRRRKDPKAGSGGGADGAASVGGGSSVGGSSYGGSSYGGGSDGGSTGEASDEGEDSGDEGDISPELAALIGALASTGGSSGSGGGGGGSDLGASGSGGSGGSGGSMRPADVETRITLLQRRDRSSVCKTTAVTSLQYSLGTTVKFLFVSLLVLALFQTVPLLASVLPSRASAMTLSTTPPLQIKLCHKDQLAPLGAPPPPLVFSIPVLCGTVCLVVDENGKSHAMRDSCPPLGSPISATGVVDSEIGVIEDLRFGTRFYLSSGAPRGRLCPGGTAPRALRWLASRWMQAARVSPQLETYELTEDEDGWLCAAVPAPSALLRDR